MKCPYCGFEGKFKCACRASESARRKQTAWAVQRAITAGMTQNEACRVYGIASKTFTTWKRKYPGIASHV